MSQVLWFRDAHEHYYQFRKADTSVKGGSYEAYVDSLTNAITAGKGTFDHWDDCIVKRSGIYARERDLGQSVDYAFKVACSNAPPTLSLGDGVVV